MKPHSVKQIESPMFRLDPGTKLQEFHKEHDQMRSEIILLKKNLAFLEQRNHEMLKNEIQYRKLIKSYQNELKKNNKFELLGDLSEKHQLGITEIHKEINSSISDLQGKVDQILSSREEMIVSMFNTKLREINEKLEKEKKEKFEDLEKGAAKKNLLKHELDMLKGSIGVIEAKNAHLYSQNKEYKHLIKMKDMEINALQKRIFEIKKSNVTFPNIKSTKKLDVNSKSKTEIKTASMLINILNYT